MYFNENSYRMCQNYSRNFRVQNCHLQVVLLPTCVVSAAARPPALVGYRSYTAKWKVDTFSRQMEILVGKAVLRRIQN